MRKRLFGVCAALLLIVGIGAVTAAAQSSISMVANIPFDFIIGTATLPAGEYKIDRVLLNNPSVLVFRSSRASALTPTQAEEPKTGKGAYKLVFHRCGDTYFLSQVWGEDGNVARTLPKSKLEQEMTASVGSPSVVTVAANNR
jgi:hypothetical protein